MFDSRAASNRKNLVGQRFERLEVLSYAKTKGRHAYWWCKCDCGIVKTIDGAALRNKLTKSCGCRKRDVTTARNRARTQKDAPRIAVTL